MCTVDDGEVRVVLLRDERRWSAGVAVARQGGLSDGADGADLGGDNGYAVVVVVV